MCQLLLVSITGVVVVGVSFSSSVSFPYLYTEEYKCFFEAYAII